VNKNPTDATVCRYLFTAKLLYMFDVTRHDNRTAFHYGTGIDGLVTQFGFETGTLKSDKHTKKQMKS